MKFDLLYTRTAVARALQTTLKRIRRVRVFWNAVWVWVQGQRPKFFSKKLFYAAFVAFRRAGAENAEVRHVMEPGFEGYEVRCATSRDWHVVSPGTEEVWCDCPDYHRQIDTFGKGCCKHGYAVLNLLGYSSLREYVNAFG